MSEQVSITRRAIITMVWEATWILQYYIAGPIIFTLFDTSEDVIITQGYSTAEAVVWSPQIHDILFYGYASLTVFAILAGIISLYLYARRIYYASGSVWVQ